jgi:hypothetical protein
MTQRLANEALLDERWALFRKELLLRIDRNPELYLDANIQFQVIRGRVMNSNTTERSRRLGDEKSSSNLLADSKTRGRPCKTSVWWPFLV